MSNDAIVQRILASKQEDAYQWLIDFLKKYVGGHATQTSGTASGAYGYDLAMPTLAGDYGIYLGAVSTEHHTQTRSHYSACLYDALWELCKRGVLRVSPKTLDSTPSISPGLGYTLTMQGRMWLSGSGFEPVLIASGNFAKLLAAHHALFGDDYLERCQEAIRCFDAGAYLAACVMCGAATESIFLSVAIAKIGDTSKVMADYNKPSGRKNLERMLDITRHPKSLQNEILSAYTILKYWRDDAAHGAAAGIDSTEAQVSLHLLYLFAQTVSKRWLTLTG